MTRGHETSPETEISHFFGFEEISVSSNVAVCTESSARTIAASSILLTIKCVWFALWVVGDP
jgi:hypothetical protein